MVNRSDEMTRKGDEESWEKPCPFHIPEFHLNPPRPAGDWVLALRQIKKTHRFYRPAEEEIGQSNNYANPLPVSWLIKLVIWA